MNEAFQRTSALIGAENLLKLNNSSVLVFGAGGVGGYVLEALARSGVGRIGVVDNDVFSVSNLNRQILSTVNTVGRKKTEVAKERMLSINPDMVVDTYDLFYGNATMDKIDLSLYDYVVDAIDTVSAKLLLIESCTAAKIKVISCMGTGNKLDPTAFKVSDISKTNYCPLAKTVRRELRKRGITSGVKVVYSEETPKTPDYGTGEAPLKGIRVAPASIAFVPSVAGLVIAAEVVKDLIKSNK